ncbi:MAG: PQQ-binding-like beta-propeller repeat protein [candidate division WOR-3 bacterium]|nr:PQQ-binding-like beta-propeller repeat protein [candidate division WOR-3 bacterium]
MKKSRGLLAYAVFFAACLLLPAALHAQQGSMDWTRATAQAGWSGREAHTSVVFDNKMWVLGGRVGSLRMESDVWYSSDGASWTRACSSASWYARFGHTSVVFNNKMWVIGGYDDNGNCRNDVWYSSDGVSWTQATASAGWSGREAHTSVVFDNKMWVMGGEDGYGTLNDVWYSSDGVSWTQATAGAGWSGRAYHTSVVFNNKMWVIGGGHYSGGYQYLNDVWYSSDGANWTRACSSASWSARAGHTSVVFNNKMGVIGGHDGAYHNDVWYSSDGANWTSACSSASWSARAGHTSVVFDNKMWAIGGYYYSGGYYYLNDVWWSRGGVTLVAPNGGESWAGNSTQTVRWRVFGNPSSCRLLLSRNGGSTFADTIATGIAPTDTTYSWHLPIWDSTRCRLKVQGLDSSGAAIIEDASDSNFTIRTAATVVSPNGGEVWPGGSSQTIKWHTVGSGFARYRLLLSTNGGSTYPDTITPNVAPTETTYSWHVPTLNLNTCRVMVQILDAGGALISQDASNANFTIQTAATVVSPNGGETWPGGSTQAIKWHTVGSGFARYRLMLSIDAGSTYPDTIAQSVAPTETTYSWLVPTLSLATCRVMVQILDASGGVISQDASDANFTIQTAATVVSPNGGETWPGGSSQTIKWHTVGSGFARYRLLLSINGGSTYPDTIAQSVAPTETTYGWHVPTLNLATCRVMVQILDAGGGVISQDASNANFTIQTAATVVSPNGGETWPGGSNQTIKWHTVGSGFARYRLLLSRNGGTSYPDTIASNVTPTETTYSWFVPTLNLATCRVMVQILDAGGGVISQDASNANFTIQTAATVVSPNGGEAWAGGSSQTVRWRIVGTGFAQYRLLLSTDAGSNYPDTVAPNVAPTETTYDWTVSSANSLTCRLKVQILDSLGTLISEDPGDANFEVDSRLPASVRDLQTVGERPLRSATLGWTAPGDDSMTGLASGYDIRYSLSSINDSSWQYANQCTGEPAPSTPGAWQTYTVTSLQVDRRYYFAMKTWDNAHNWSLLSNVPSCSTSSPILASSQYPMFRYGLQHSGRSPYNGTQSSDLRWFYNTAQPIISSPVVAPDTTIYVVSENDTLYAMTPSGARRWSYYLGQGTQSVPAIASDSTICVGDGQGNLVVFPRNLSAPLWRYHTGGSILSSPAIGNDGVIYVGSNDGYLYAISPDSTLKWRHHIGSGVRSSPAISPDSTIYVGADDGKLYAINPDSTEKWNVAMPAALYSSPLVGPDGTVYVGCLNGKLFAVDSQGTVKWSFTTGDSIISSPAIDAEGRIFFGSCDHSVYAIEDSGSYARPVWRYQTSGAVRSSPSISTQGTVYIGSDDGNIYAFRGSDSTVVWTRTTGSAVRSSPAIGANGTIYVGSDDGRLYAIGYASGIEEREAAVRLDIPASDVLCHGEPNPFVSMTTIRFGLSRAGRASLKVYSTAGAVVRILVSESKSPGYYAAPWDGIDDRGRSVPAGIYVCRLQTAEIQTTTIIAKLK